MRISSLALEAYGHFSDRTIDLRSDAALTLIHGGNEAGKSTALKAVTDLLFGIEVRSVYGWRHDLKNMSLAGTFRYGDGEAISVRRLKRQARTLVDFASNEPLSDDALQPFLKGRSRATFEEVFGLDQARLRAGGKKLLLGGGDLADSLVAASPGLANVLELRDSLSAEAARFHNHQRKNSSTQFALASAARDAARKAIRDTEVRADDFKRVSQELEDAERARNQAVAAEATARTEVARFVRLQRAANEISAIDRLAGARAALQPIPDLDPAGVRAARATIQATNDARRVDLGCREELGVARAALAAIVVDGTLLDGAALVESLDERRAVVAHALEDVPKRQDEAAATRGSLARLASDLGLAGTDELRSRLPGDPTLARADRLVDRMRALETSSRDAADALSRLESARTRSRAELGRLGDAPDPSVLRLRLEALDGCEERAEAAKRAKVATATEARRLDSLVAPLALGARDLASLTSLSLPSVAQANAAAKRLSDAEGELERAALAEAMSNDAEARCGAKVEAIQAPGDIPTPAAVEAVRRVRDATWAKLRPILVAEREIVDEDRHEVSILDDSIPGADRLADERWAGSARAADLLQAEIALGQAKADARGAKARTAEKRRSLDEARAAWDGLWIDPHVASSEPADAVERLRRAYDLVSQGDRLARLRDDETASVARSDMDGRLVEKLAEDLGLDGAHASVADIRAAIVSKNARFQERRDCERDIRNNEHAIFDLEERRKALDFEAEAIRMEATNLWPALGIRPDAGSGEARAALGAWRDAKAAIPALEQLEHRLARIERARADFVKNAEAALRAVAPDDFADGPFVGVRRLRTRVDAARQADARAADARLILKGREATCDRSASELGARVADLDGVLARLGAGAETDLPPMLDRAEKAHVIDGETYQARSRLEEVLAGRSEADARVDLGSNDALALVGLQSTAEAAASAASAEVAATIERHVLARTALTAMESRVGAAAAAQDEQDAIAAMAVAADGFLRNHVAGRLLAAAIDRYRERHQSPIVNRASAAFAAMTVGRWDGVAIDYGEDKPVLKPVRAGKLHDLTALSEGTADQLFLALRVAAIEEHALASEPLPLVLDDPFAAFDEERTAEGLAVLAGLGRTTQVVLFTHHEHVVDGARRRLGDGVDVIRL